MALQKLRLEIRKGSAENIPIRIESGAWRYASISAVAQSAPLRITADETPPDGWRAAIMNVKAIGAFAAQNNPPKDAELHAVTRIDGTTVEFNAINGAAFRAHAGGGQLAWRIPLDLALYTDARMNVRDKVRGALLANWSVTSGHLELDADHSSLWLRLKEADAAQFSTKDKVFDIELIRGNGDPDRVCAADSVLAVFDESTTE